MGDRRDRPDNGGALLPRDTAIARAHVLAVAGQQALNRFGPALLRAATAGKVPRLITAWQALGQQRTAGGSTGASTHAWAVNRNSPGIAMIRSAQRPLGQRLASVETAGRSGRVVVRLPVREAGVVGKASFRPPLLSRLYH